jgi:hypothetical protein
MRIVLFAGILFLTACATEPSPDGPAGGMAGASLGAPSASRPIETYPDATGVAMGGPEPARAGRQVQTSPDVARQIFDECEGPSRRTRSEKADLLLCMGEQTLRHCGSDQRCRDSVRAFVRREISL